MKLDSVLKQKFSSQQVCKGIITKQAKRKKEIGARRVGVGVKGVYGTILLKVLWENLDPKLKIPVNFILTYYSLRVQLNKGMC